MHAQIVLFDGFDPLDVIAPYEVLYAGGTSISTPKAVVDLRRDHGVLTGTAKAERLPASKVTGQRRTILAATEHRP